MTTQPDSGDPPQMRQFMDLILGFQESLRAVNENHQASIALLQNKYDKLQNNYDDLQDSFTLLQDRNDILQSSLARLERENAKQREATRILERHTGVLFPQFPKLPLELRRIIWQFACRTPQTHVITDSGIRRSKIYSVIRACKEAKAAAAILHLDYFIVGGGGDTSFNWTTPSGVRSGFVGGLVKNHLNPSVDILWLNVLRLNVDYLDLYYWNLHLTCGRNQACAAVEKRPKPVQKFAINYPTWLRWKESKVTRLLSFLEKFGILELLIVVGRTDHIDIQTDVVFTPPLTSPASISRAMSTPEDLTQISLSGTWSDNENLEHQNLLEIRTKCLPALKSVLENEMFVRNLGAKRKNKLKESNSSSEEDVGDQDFEVEEECSVDERLAQWEIPKVRFVQPVVVPPNWVQPLLEK